MKKFSTLFSCAYTEIGDLHPSDVHVWDNGDIWIESDGNEQGIFTNIDELENLIQNAKEFIKARKVKKNE